MLLVLRLVEIMSFQPFSDIPTNAKRCSECTTISCIKGRNFEVPERKGYQRYICNQCIAKMNSKLLLHALKINALSGPEVEAARAGIGCPQECVTRSRGLCSVATRAYLLRDLDDFLDSLG
jgi:hypothetical protein